ncbi:MAG: helix-turn-helix transcriptional regulator [Candidatus Edwardsbacteria bacterium]|nr:helix-turn-helix transcriptional regulator [Candidatus Edwardsbacteria bacterium]MBU1576850.1 helix-turn-helix transcriptional regulator [Candidatus Edwardsbacteria bacterium]MBU2463809.1 helix-turn-helix transcriptional regulator [Candidatus Edwardsbacteria bacterium]MBU2593381.1 helix-turn-helix transcriptional regulator [Candidatus Edwardsbacteria bacterium]
MIRTKQEAEKAFTQKFKALHSSPVYYAELLKIEVTEAIYNLMETKKINKAELARKLGCKPPYITKLLRGTANITLDSLAKIAFMLDAKINTRFEPLANEFDFSQYSNIIPMPCYTKETITVKRAEDYGHVMGWS